MKSLLAACALLASWPAAGQAPAPAGAQPPQPPASTGTTLNLRLDDAMRSRPAITFGPAAKEAESGLPSLGSDARRIEAPARAPDSRSAPYPKDTEQGR